MSEDPDYVKSSPLKDDERIREMERSAEEVVKERTRKIIEREFRRAVEDKVRELDLIDERILEVRKALHLVRYGAVVRFYDPVIPKRTRSDPSAMAIHPAARPLVAGKSPVSSICTKEEEKTPPKVIPSYVPPKVEEPMDSKEPRGSRFKLKRRFVVGNVSKWIRCDERGEDRSTHKWMIYVRGDKDNPDISDVIEKVRFLIHASYHPHDVVEVRSPPFHLTRRGWGEFPARIQIHFKHPDDKPVDIIHSLKLDRTYTGLQTLGSETHVDVWCRNMNFSPPIIKCESSETKPNFGGNVVSHSSESDMRPKIKNEPSEEFTDNGVKPLVSDDKPQSLLLNNRNAEKTKFIRCTDKTGKVYYLPVTLLRNNASTVTTNSTQAVQPSSLVKLPEKKSLIKPMHNPGCKLVLLQDGQVKVVKSSYVPRNLAEKSRTTMSPSVKPGMSLLRKPLPQTPTPPPTIPQPQKPLIVNGSTSHLTDLEKTVPDVSLATWKTILGRFGDETQAEIENRVAKRGVHFLKKQTEILAFLNKKVLQLRINEFPSWERMASYIVKFLPLVTGVASEPLYRSLHPYAAPTITEYQSWNFGKRMASEWLRAKTICRIIKRTIDISGKDFSGAYSELTTRRIWKHLKYSGFSVQEKGEEYRKLEVPRKYTKKSSTLTTFDFEFQNEGLESDKDLKRSIHRVRDEEGLIDIIGIEEAVEPKKRRKNLDETKNSFRPERTSLIFPEDQNGGFRYVREATESIGIQLNTEEVAPNVHYPMAQKMIFTACQSFCELLIRQSIKSNNEYSNGSSSDALVIELIDVQRAIRSETSLKIFSNAGLGISSGRTNKNKC